MWQKVIALYSVVIIVTAENIAPGIDRTVSEGVASEGYSVVYGDEDLTIINEVVEDAEKNVLKKKPNLNEIKPLPAEDVKCLMSVDRYCSKSMSAIKSVLIQALKEDCEKCSTEQKEEAGKVIASMMAHDPVGWKLFLTRTALQIKPKKQNLKEENVKYKLVGEPEEVESSKYRYVMPGAKVRVKRYQMEKI